MESTQKRLRTASAANSLRQARSKPFSGRFSVDFATQNDLRFERGRRAKLASRGTAMSIANVRFVPQNAVSQLCSPKSEIAGAARKIDETTIKNQLRNATCEEPVDAAVSSTFFAPKSTKNKSKSIRIGCSGASIGPLERLLALEAARSTSSSDQSRLGWARSRPPGRPRVAPRPLGPPYRSPSFGASRSLWR